ncbi:hypothetical protein [Flavihumibacter petaseus]|uniref:Uncharacterized protein n=1 Tax=Flavihumibacter petaseus NBRC 106054 TaxID=1220578 RepID=A0A0E9MZP2_9BACT|nr:hypothetical protein [Flavihumibacter petaseus]GAO43034.1 hypothetical protein FPE01S_02_01390 [Flavihumibacter petaseus NBRC 106054]
MDIQQLRIGNWVKRFPYTAGKSPNGQPRMVDGAVKIEIGILNDISNFPGEYEPIAITPEILQRCGFESITLSNGDKVYHIPCTPPGCTDEYWLRYSHTKGTAGIVFSSENSATIHSFPCKYLHQLQNLFYSITGEEMAVAL